MKYYRKEVAALLKLRRIFVNELTSFTGRTNHVACLLYAWRPFISDLWGAIYVRRRKGSRIWIKQVLKTLKWLSVFLHGQRGALIRKWTFRSWLDPQSALTMILDASPFGLGGVLVASDRIVSFFSSDLTKDDVRIHHHEIGQDTGQQVWDTLCICSRLATMVISLARLPMHLDH